MFSLAQMIVVCIISFMGGALTFMIGIVCMTDLMRKRRRSL